MSVATAEAPSAPPPAPSRALPTEACPLCGTPLHAEQEWCLRCGAAARTRLAASPNWRAPLLAALVAAVLSLGVLAAALVKLAGGSGSAAPASTTTVTTASPAGAAVQTTTTATVPSTSTPTATTPGSAAPGSTSTTQTTTKAQTTTGAGGTSAGGVTGLRRALEERLREQRRLQGKQGK